jgi:predicted dinucleotide-binding enzyme
VKIAVIGMGKVGGVLGRRWAGAGHQITFGVRDPGDPDKRERARAAGASLASVRKAAADAEVVLLAVPWRAVPDALKEAGDLAGKVLLDCTNPLRPDYFGLVVGTTDSAGEQVARMMPRAKVVKIFNTNGAANMADPDYGPSRVTMLYAGDDGGGEGGRGPAGRGGGLRAGRAGPLVDLAAAGAFGRDVDRAVPAAGLRRGLHPQRRPDAGELTAARHRGP